MKRIILLILSPLFLMGCYQTSLAPMLGPAAGASQGRIAHSAISSGISYGVKKQTGKAPLEHVKAYAEKINPEKKKEPCLSFLEKTNSEVCAILKRRLILTKSKIKFLDSENKPD